MPRRTTTGTTNSNEALYAFDTARRAEHGTVCGVDEAGRGPLCGPVCCAAVILNPDDPIEGVNDSKKLTEKRRDALYEEITKRALATPMPPPGASSAPWTLPGTARPSPPPRAKAPSSRTPRLPSSKSA